MRRTLAHGLLYLALSGVAVAQDVTGQLAAAQLKIAAKEWEAALELLLELSDTTTSGPELEQVAGKLMEVGKGLSDGSAFPAALRAHAAALAMRQRLHGDRDHADVATSLNRLAACHRFLGQWAKALPRDQEALAMRQQLYEGDHHETASSLNNLAIDLATLGLPEQALVQFEAALHMRQRLFPGRDHADVATSLNNVARCRFILGQVEATLPQFEEALALRQRLFSGRDHADVAQSLVNLAACLRSLSQPDQALPRYEAALAMYQRLYVDRDHKDMATSLNDLAVCYSALGQSDEALVRFEAALAMRRRIYRDRDHPSVAESLNNTALSLVHLGRSQDALPRHDEALAMGKRVHDGEDHPEVAMYLGNLAICLQSLDRAAEALPHFEDALAMYERVLGESDHPSVAWSLEQAAGCQVSLGHAGQAMPRLTSALAMRQRLYGDRDHRDVARSLNDVAGCRLLLGQGDKALEPCEQACAMIERLRERSATSSVLRQSLFDQLKHGSAFERMQTLHAGNPAEALRAAERSRARGLLDLMEQQRFDPLDEALRRASLRGDTAAARRMPELRGELDRATLEGDQLLRQLINLADSKVADAERESQRRELIEQSDRVAQQRRELLDERARFVADVLPAGRVRTAAEIQAVLREGELLLEFTVTKAASFVYVVAREGKVLALPLPAAEAAVERALPLLLGRTFVPQLVPCGRDPGDGVRADDEGPPAREPLDQRGRDPGAGKRADDEGNAARELFKSLIPAELWPRLQAARRVYLAAHRSLHRLPFELLVTGVVDREPVYWLDSGPEIAYVQSGSALCWQRERARQAGDDATGLDLLAIGDPRALAAEPEMPEQGAWVLAVADDAARSGLQPGDVLVAYDGVRVVDDTMLAELTKAGTTRVPVEVWRRGAALLLELSPGPLPIQCGKGKARAAAAAALGGEAQLEQITRSGDLERLARLPPLRGARQETEVIAAAFQAQGRKVERLLDHAATESAVFDLAAKAKYLHFACHGFAEEYAGQSFSMLVLSQPQHVQPGDDGLLKLHDLLHGWRGRLASCQLVVLSACRTNVGPLLRDEAPQALPLGFLFAGAQAVISSLWAVDDASTRELMTDFYGRLLAGEKDRLHAFTAARKALRGQARYKEPFHWAPFLYLGIPE